MLRQERFDTHQIRPMLLKVNAACPGSCRMNLNNHAGTQTVEEGAREPVCLAFIGPDGPTSEAERNARDAPVVTVHDGQCAT